MHVAMSLLLVAFAADPKDDTAQAELKKFQGLWTMVSGHVDGKPISDEHVKKNVITWEENTCTLISPHQSKEPIRAKITKLTPKTQSGELEWKREKGPGNDVVMLAIYEWDGQDTYTIAFDPTGKKRPTSVKPEPGTIVHVWKRMKMKEPG